MTRTTVLYIGMLISFFAVAGEVSAYIPTPNCPVSGCIPPDSLQVR